MNEEMRVPGLGRIEQASERAEKEGLLWREFDSDFNDKKLHQLQVFANLDLEDCIIPDGPKDIDQSIHNLRRDIRKTSVGLEGFRQWSQQTRDLDEDKWYTDDRPPKHRPNDNIIFSLDREEDDEIKFRCLEHYHRTKEVYMSQPETPAGDNKGFP